MLVTCSLLVAASAGLYTLLFPPFELRPLVWIALIPLFVAVTRVRPAAAAGYGALWAILSTAGVAWWFPGMLERYFGTSPGEAWLGLVAAGLFINAVPYAAFAAWLSWSARRGPACPWVVAACWGVAEYARVHGWIANPLGLIGYAPSGAALSQTADLGGPYLVGMLVVAGSCALAGLRVPHLGGRRPLRSVAVCSAALAAAMLYGEWRLAREFGEGDPIQVSLVQGGIARELVWDRSRREANLQRYLDLTRGLEPARPDLVFWPEFAIDFYLREQTPYSDRLRAGVQSLRADLVVGGAHYRPTGGGTRYFNSVFLIDHDGDVGDRYDKRRLVPFAEYGPLGDWLRAETAVYSPGASSRPLSSGIARVGAFVCAETLFPEVARTLAREGAEILANPSNDYWFGHPAASRHQLRVAQLRAIENRRYLVRPTATGVSAVIDPSGRVLARSRGDGAEVLSAAVRRSSAVTVYQELGDANVAIALLCVLGAGFRRGRPDRNTGGRR